VSETPFEDTVLRTEKTIVQRPVDLQLAREAYRELKPLASKHGYLLALYGSVIGAIGRDGRDLDLVAVKMRADCDEDAFVADLIKLVQGVKLDKRNPDLKLAQHSMGGAILAENGMLLDILFVTQDNLI
jgi:hypothetical protein